MDAEEYLKLLGDLNIGQYFYKDGVFHCVDHAHVYMIVDRKPINEHDLKKRIEKSTNQIQENHFKIFVPDNAKTHVPLSLGDMGWIATKKISDEFPHFVFVKKGDDSFIGFLPREDSDDKESQLKRRNMTGNDATSCYDSNLLGLIMRFLLKCWENNVSVSFNNEYPLSMTTDRFSVLLAPRMDSVLPKSFVVEDDLLSYESEE